MTARIEIRQVAGKADDRLFTRLPFSLYKGEGMWVPPIMLEENHFFDPKHNASLRYAQCRRWLALREGKPVGRVAAILNPRVNEARGERRLRFSHLDFIDDAEVLRALMQAVEGWARELGMEAVMGPYAFTDMDRKGILVEGYDELPTVAGPWNFAYYGTRLEELGYAKLTDWIEYSIAVPEAIPEKMARIAEIVRKKNNLRAVPLTSTRQLKRYADEVFDVLNAAYADIFGFIALTPEEIRMYTDLYFGFIRTEYLALVVDENDRVVAFGISMPSLSRAMQKTKGRVNPFTALTLLRAMRHNDLIDLYLVGVVPEYQKKGVNAMLFEQLIPVYIRNGIKAVETNHELEDNAAVQQQWKFFDRRQHKRRRCYIRNLNDTGETA